MLRDPSVFSDLIELMTESIRKLNVDVVVGLDARGFLFGPIISYQLKLPFVPIRKKGKLPGGTVQVTYKLEYGSVSTFSQRWTWECQVWPVASFT